MLERRGQNNHFFFGGKRCFYIIPGKVFEHKFILHCCLFIKVWKCNFDTSVFIAIWMNVFTRSMPTRFFQADNVLPRTFWRYFKYAFLTDCWLTIEFFTVVRIYTLFVMSNHVFFFHIAMMKIGLGTAFWVWNTTRASDTKGPIERLTNSFDRSIRNPCHGFRMDLSKEFVNRSIGPFV